MRYSLPLNIVRYANGTLVKLTASATDFISYDYDPDQDTGTYTPASIVLSAKIAGNLTYRKWQYRKDGGSWIDIPATNDLSITITSSSLTVLPGSSLFDKTNSYVLFRCVATDNDNGEEYTDTAEIGRIVDYIILYRKQQTKIDQDAGKIALIASDEQLRQYGRANTVVSDLAALKVTASEISSTVSKKVGNNEVISKINQSAESVKISASKVNVEGAAIFTSGRLSQNSLNDAYDAKNAASTAVTNLKNDLASASGSTVINGGHIATGTIDASKATIKNINADNIVAGTISDSSKKNIWNLDSGQFVTKKGEIAGFSISESGIEAKSTSSSISLTTARFSQVRDTYSSLTNPRTYAHNGVRIGSGRIAFISGKGSSVTAARENAVEKYIFDVNLSGGSGGVSDNLDFRSNLSYPYNTYASFKSPTANSPIEFVLPVRAHNFTAAGTKSRVIKTQNYGERLNYAYETPTPFFGDIGEAQLDEDGFCYVDIDDIFSETIECRQEYQVFLQKEGQGDCWIADKQPRYFVIQGTPSLKVAWELKAKQRDYDMIRLEQADHNLDEYECHADSDSILDDYINEQEELLYG